jgi:hypothetical protein
MASKTLIGIVVSLIIVCIGGVGLYLYKTKQTTAQQASDQQTTALVTQLASLSNQLNALQIH